MAQLQSFLGWSLVIHLGILLYWFLCLVLAKDWIYKLHNRWFQISATRFDEIHYTAFAFYKLSVFILVMVPYLAMLIVY